MQRTCYTCLEAKPLSEFHRLRHDKLGVQRRCKTCIREYQRARTTGNTWHEALEGQQGLCAVCHGVMPKPCADHDHTTGVFRGLVCYGCNLLIAQHEKGVYHAQVSRYLGCCSGDQH